MKYAEDAVSPCSTMRVPLGTSRIVAPSRNDARRSGESRANAPIRPARRSKSASVAALIGLASRPGTATDARRRSAAARHVEMPRPGATNVNAADTNRSEDEKMIKTRMSTMSARPAPAMPNRKMTSRMT